jgi:N-acetylglucosamine malate deacetylase 2
MSIVTKAIRRSYNFADTLVYNLSYAALKTRMGAECRYHAISDLPVQPALVVVAHPDDEIVGAGALLARLKNASVVIVTDGAPKDGSAARAAGFRDNRDYRQARARESAAALALIGRDEMAVTHFGFPDQQAVFKIGRIVPRLMQLIRAGKFRYVVTHPYEGGHPDHDATALVVYAACLLLREEGFETPIPVEMTSYHSIDGQTVYGRFLPFPDAGPIETVTLDARERDLKRRMVECHRTQHEVLKDFPLDAERFRMAPSYDFLRPPHTGWLGYEAFIWRIDGAGWRRAAGRALRRLGLLEPS